MLSSRLIRAYRFFRTHGLQVVGERTIYALKYARAELLAKDAGCTWEWTDDFDGWVELSTNDFLCSCGCGHKIERCEGCIMRDADGVVLASLCGIWDASEDYRRIVQAELAIEAQEALLAYAI